MTPQTRRNSQSQQRETDPPEIPLTDIPLPTTIVDRLRAAGIHSTRDWLVLNRRRRSSIFGITRRISSTIDEAVARKLGNAK
jgi:hypothetical protein